MSLILDGSGTITGATTLASTASININGTVGATTPAAGAFTSVAASGITTVADGTAALPAIVSTTGTADTGLWFPAADTVAVSTAGVEALRIDSSGTLLVGCTTTPAQNVQGILLASGSSQSYQKISHGTRTTTAEYFYFYNGNGQVGSISSNGSTTSYSTSSDYRLKNTIAPMTGALAKVAQLKPVTYKWKLDGSDGEGFIAHELAEVCPHAVTGAKDAVDADGKPVHQGIDTSFLVATLTAAIQELKAIIDTQAAQITTLNAKVGI